MIRMLFTRGRFAPIALLAFSLFAPTIDAQSNQTRAPRVEGIRFWSFGDVTRIAVETSGEYKLYSESIEKPNRVYFDLTGLAPPSAAQHGMQTIPVGDNRIRQIRVARLSDTKTRIVFDLDSSVEVLSSQLVNPDRLMIEIRPKGTSLPSLSASRSVVGSQKVNLAAHNGGVDSDIAESAPANKNLPKSVVVAVLKPVKEALKEDPTDAYHPNREAANREPANREPANREPANREPANREPANREPANREPANREPANREAANHETTNRDAATRQPATRTPPVVLASAAPVPNIPVPAVINIVPPAANPMPAGVGMSKIDNPSSDRSLVRILGLKLGRVVIDAGHGGHDSGTVGPNGLMEKELVLDVALRLGALITKQMGAEVIYTRSNDVFIPLEQRTRIANEQKADLFISVHANSSSEPSATGVETYYFNLNADKTGLDLATRENASADSSISDLNDMLHRAVLQTKREESREFAQRVQASLTATAQKSSTYPVDRGVRQAPFVVLIGATMPSILAEIGFVSNPRDEKMLRKSDQRQKLAEALFKGVVQYSNSLNHVQIARAGAE